MVSHSKTDYYAIINCSILLPTYMVVSVRKNKNATVQTELYLNLDDALNRVTYIRNTVLGHMIALGS